MVVTTTRVTRNPTVHLIAMGGFTSKTPSIYRFMYSQGNISKIFFRLITGFFFKFSSSLFQLHLMLSGARIGYFSGDIKRLLEDCKELQ